MPLEEVEIGLSEVDPYWAGAHYFSIIVYPDAIDMERRANYRQALIRWTLEQRMTMDPKWTNGIHLLRPGYFSGSERQQEKLLNEGNKRLHRWKSIAEHVVLPHLRSFDTGRPHLVDGGQPEFQRMFQLALKDLKLKEGNFDTVAHRDWRPLKPVVHALCAYMVWDNVLWEMWGRNPGVDRKMAFLMFPEYVVEVVEIAEHFRSQVCQISSFKISEANTVRITTRNIDADSEEEPVGEVSPSKGTS